MKIKLKICGINDPKILKLLIRNYIDYFGLIFYEKSPRYVNMSIASDLCNIAKYSKTNPVGVFVDFPIKKIQKYINKLDLQYIQLHGNESMDYIKEISKNHDVKIIKKIAIGNKKDIEIIKNFLKVDYLLFDYKPKSTNDLPGGNAKKFDWKIIKDLKISKKYFLSGGINDRNIKNAFRIKNLYGFDISSGVEDRPGIKNIGKILEILKIIKENYDYKK